MLCRSSCTCPVLRIAAESHGFSTYQRKSCSASHHGEFAVDEFTHISKNISKQDDGWPESVEEQSLLLLVWRHAFYTQALLHTDAFTHRRFYTQTLFTRRRFYTQTLLHTDAFTHRHFYTQKYFYTQTLLHTDAFTHRNTFTHRRFYTQKYFYTQTLLHTDTFTHRRFLHTEAFYTQRLLHTDSFYTQTL